MKVILPIAVVVVLQFLDYAGVAQKNELKFNLVEGANGKPLGKIRNMCQDSHGYIWLADEMEKCIFRYDGNRMIVFRHDDANPNSLGGSSINSVYADAAGKVWVGFNDAGLDELDPSTGIFKHYRAMPNNPDSLSGAVTPILRDRRGRLWIGTDNGLDRLDEKTGKFIHYRNKPGDTRSLSSNQVINIYEDRQGTIWIGTNYPWDGKSVDEGGLNRLEPDGSFTRYMHDPKNPHSLISNKVRAIFEDSRGVFWVGTAGDGLHIMDRKTGSFERLRYNPLKPDQLSRPPLKADKRLNANDQVTFIIEDCVGSIWIGSMWSGINRYDTLTKKVTHYEHSNGFPDSSGWNAFQSRDGEMWISTQSNNLYRVDPFQKFIPSIITGDAAWNFLEDQQGFLWVGTRGSGLFKYDQHLNLIRQFKHDPSDSLSLPGDAICPLFQNRENEIWVGAKEGLRVLDEVTQKFYRFPGNVNLKAFNDSGASNIFRDRDGYIWFSKWGQGLIRYNTKDHSIIHFYSSERDSSTISTNNVGTTFADQSGELWVGTNNGINRLDKKTGGFVRYLYGKKTWALHLYQDSKGNLWAGTDKGLYVYNTKEDRFLNFFESRSEFSSLAVSGVTEDNSKNLWLFSESAIIRLSLVTGQIFIYGSKYGVEPFSMETWKCAHKNRAGRIFIPHGTGFYTFLPKELAGSPDLPIIITDLLVNSQLVSRGKESPVSIQKPMEETSDLDLKYNQNNIVFNFAAIDYRAPEATKYFYMLANYDREWREVKDKNEKASYYFNLSPGNYVYHVKASNNDGTVAEREIIIRIHPPWWETWWAYSLYLLALVTAVWAFIRWRTRSLQKEKMVLEHKVAERTKELKKEKEVVESTLAELKSTQVQLIQSEKMASLGELTAGIAHEIQNPLNFVNNFSEINSELIEELANEKLKDKNKRDESLEDQLLVTIRENEKKINHHGKRADAIVKGMLQHSRTSTGHKELTAINALADEYLRLSYHGLRAKDKNFNATLQTDFDESIGKISLVPQDIGRVLLNLYNNAFYAVAEKKKQQPEGYDPTVTVSTKKINGQSGSNRIEISVRDNGMGIPQKVIDKIFQPFFTTKPTGQGTGLGLSLVYDIIKAHSGEIKLTTKEGEGTTFSIELPT